MHTVKGNLIEVFRRLVRRYLLEADPQAAAVGGYDLVVVVHFGDVDFLSVDTDETEIAARRDFTPAAGRPVEHVDDAGPQVVVEERIRIVEYGDAADVFCLDVDAARVVVGVGPVDAVFIVADLELHVNDIGRRRIGDIGNLTVDRGIFDRRIEFAVRINRVVLGDVDAVLAGLPVAAIGGEDSQVAVGQPFKEGDLAAVEIDALGIVLLAGFVNSDPVVDDGRHEALVIGIEAAAVRFRPFAHGFLLVRAADLEIRRRREQDLVQIEINSSLNGDAGQKDCNELS